MERESNQSYEMPQGSSMNNLGARVSEGVAGTVLRNASTRSAIGIEDQPNCLYPEKACQHMLNNGNCGTDHYCEYAEELK